MRFVDNNYLLTKSEVFKGKSQAETLPARIYRAIARSIWKSRGDFSFQTECLRLISCLLYDFLICLNRPVIDPCTLREDNAVELTNQRERSIRQKHKPDNKAG